MDTKLQDNILLEIFRYLPIRERILVGRVNKKFHTISEKIIGETKSLNLDNPVFKRVSSGQLSNLIKLCSANLERVNLTETSHLETFSQLTCPRLGEIRIEMKTDQFKNADIILGNLIRNNPNLKILSWQSWNHNFKFPKDVKSEQLETLKLWGCDNATLLSLCGRCPNLKHFRTVFTEDVVQKTMDEFLAGCPQMIILEFDHEDKKFDLETLTSFWQLTHLRRLRLGCLINDSVLTKIAQSLSRLEFLDLSNLNVGNRGIGALASLKELRKLKLAGSKADLDEGLRKLSDCKELQNACLNFDITSKTLIALVQSCPELQTLDVNNIIDVETTEKATEVVRALDGFGEDDLWIWFNDRNIESRIWHSAEVDQVLGELEDKTGRVITFYYRGDRK